MNDYGRGGAVLASATVLPATTAGVFVASTVDPMLASAFLVVNAIWLVIVAGQISRYFTNKRKAK